METESNRGSMGGAMSRHKRNNFGPPWQSSGRLRGRGAVGRISCSRNRRREGVRVGKLACWVGDKRRPGGQITLCDRRIC